MFPRRLMAILALLVLVGGALIVFTGDDEDDDRERRDGRPPRANTPATNEVVQRACELPKKSLLRIWRGFYPHRTSEIQLVPKFPNFSGAFTYPGHSGPWAYLQNVPLVLYGPKWIQAAGRVETHANITDVYPTVGELLDVDLPPRQGQLLTEALRPDADGIPKLIVTVVWDGVGRNVLDRWPDRWPNLSRLEQEGTSYVNATVGSSPSVTPATHSNLGTGSFPRRHGVTALVYRTQEDKIIATFLNRDASLMKLTTYADEVDQAFDNESKVGMLAYTAWHLGMLGHGTGISGGDADQFALIGHADGQITGNPNLYEMPSYLPGFLGLRDRFAEVDRADGEADGRWLGHGLSGSHDNPAWVLYQQDLLLEMLRREGYGKDDVPNLLFTNFKISDIVGHYFTMDSPEMADVLEAQDVALGSLLEYLDEEVRDYVLILTADHGHTPDASRTGAWAIGNRFVRDDVDAHFDTPEGSVLVQRSVATGLFLNHDVMDELGVTADDISSYLNDYTIRDNWEGELPEGYEDRGSEKVFAAVFPSNRLPEIMECAFGSRRPPPDLTG